MKRVVVAGHLCLDLIPAIPPQEDSLRSLLVPGKLVEVGPVTVSTGGAVANTGLALARLGAPVRLAALVGDDSFGREARRLVECAGAADGVDATAIAARQRIETALVVDPAVATSYTVVVNVPGADRVFLHCPGANDLFDPATVADEVFADAGVFHFGYPPLMRRCYGDGGAAELRGLFARARRAGLAASLDMACPDPNSPAGRVDWRAWLGEVLPEVDIFAPSLDELVPMLRPGDAPPAGEPAALARELAAECLAMGAALVAVKLGSAGLLLRGHGDAARWDSVAWPSADDDRAPASWRGVDLRSPCFVAELAGATGSGDCTVAGLLYAIARGFAPSAALDAAVAVGACNVERPDAISGIPHWDAVAARLAGGWRKREG